MRVLHCIPGLLGGGAERQLCYVAEGLVRLGHQVDVVYLLDGPNTPRLRASGATLHNLGWRKAFDPRQPFEMAKLVRQSRADLVQTWLSRMDIVGQLGARLAGRPSIYSERSALIPEAGWRDRVRYRFAAAATAIIANSEGGASYWRARRGQDAGIYVVPNGLPLDEMDAVPAAQREATGIPRDAELILYAGRMDALKNTRVLAQVIASVLERRPRAFAMCCGIGPELDVLEHEISRRGLKQRWLVPGYRADVWSLMKAANVFVSASKLEGHPNSVLEAMACRVPLVLSDIAEHHACVPNDAALFFPPGSAQAGSDAIDVVLNDTPAALHRATCARSAVSSLSVTAMSKRYETIYDEVVRSSLLAR